MSARRTSRNSSMARQRSRGRRPPPPDPAQGYVALSMRPLHMLVFILPMIVFYEIGLAVALSNNHGVFETIKAHHMIYRFFEQMHVSGVYTVYLPGILIAVVLLLWHWLERDRWSIRWPVVGMMAIESVVWTLPLLVLLHLAYRVLAGDAASGGAAGSAGSVGAAPQFAALAAAQAGASAADGSILARLTIAIGAGLYEEMLFRFALIALLHTLLVNVLAMKEVWGWGLSIVLSALAFAVYHDVTPAPGRIDWGLAAYYTLAGVYFGVLYRLRGLGIVVAVHALYDIVVLLLRGGG